LAVLLLACGNRLPPPAPSPADAADPQDTAPDDAAASDASHVAELPAADVTPKDGPGHAADALVNAAESPVDTAIADTAPSVDVGPETESTPAPDAQAEKTPTDVSQPEDVSLCGIWALPLGWQVPSG